MLSKMFRLKSLFTIVPKNHGKDHIRFSKELYYIKPKNYAKLNINAFSNKASDVPTDMELQLMHSEKTLQVVLSKCLTDYTFSETFRIWTGIIMKYYDNDITFKNLIKTKIIHMDYILEGLTLYIDLHNPLLFRYKSKFDTTDFLNGAQHAFKAVHKSIASVDISNYASGLTEISPSHDLLFNVLSKKLFNACISASKQLSDSGISIVLKDIDVTRCILLSIETEIIPNIDENNIISNNVMNKIETKVEVISLNNEIKDNKINNLEINNNNTTSNNDNNINNNDNNNSTTNNDNNINNIYKPQHATRENKQTVIEIKADNTNTTNSNNNINNIENEAIVITDNETKSYLRSLYSPGSVVATVNVLYHAKESYETKITQIKHENEEINYLLSNITRKTSYIWTFQACISGHSELEWKVIALDGLG